MKFTERVLLLIISELGLGIRSVKANCSHRAGPPATEGPAGHIGSRGEFHEEEGRGGDRFLDFLRSLEMTGKLRCFLKLSGCHKADISTPGEGRGRGPEDTSYREAMTQ